MIKNLVSIIIPTFNSRKWLGAAIESALAQTHRQCEILVVDDGSTDGTSDWLAETFGSRINCLYKDNGGLSSARNFGLMHAKGNYIQFLDADDLILPDKVSTHVEFLDGHPEYAVVYSHTVCFHDGNQDERFDWWGQEFYRSGNVFYDMVDQGFILTHAALTRRDWIDRAGHFDEDLQNCVDGDFWLRLACAGAQFYHLPGDAMALYRVRPNSQSANRIENRRSMIRVLTKVYKHVSVSDKDARSRIRRAIGRWHGEYGYSLLEAGALYQGLVHLFISLLRDHRRPLPKIARLILVPFFGWARAQAILERIKPKKPPPSTGDPSK